MKTTTPKTPFYAALALLASSLLSCNIADKINDVTFNSSIDQTITVEEDKTDDNISYDANAVFDATADAKINSYKDKIKTVDVVKITYSISNLQVPSGARQLTGGKISFGKFDGTSATISGEVASLDLVDAYSKQTKFELTLTQSDLDKLNALLKTDKKVKVYSSGTLSKGDIKLDIKILLDLKITANTI